VCGDSGIFVGRGFSHDVTCAKKVRLQPLKYRFCGCGEGVEGRGFSPLQRGVLWLLEFFWNDSEYLAILAEAGNNRN